MEYLFAGYIGFYVGVIVGGIVGIFGTVAVLSKYR